MAKESSARVSTQEEDLKKRSTKKVKTRDDVDLNQPSECMDIVGQEHDVERLSKISYKESLLTSPGLSPGGDTMAMDGIDENAPNSEDQWYIDAEKEDLGEKPFDPCPTIPVSKEEFDEWCKPWRNALIVKVLGKRVGLGFIEQRLRRDWAKKDEADYSHALLEGPWMIAGHYLIVQRWRPFFLNSENQVKKIAAWIRIPNLPIELYNPRFFSTDFGIQHDTRPNQNLPNFGPWMMVRRQNKKKKAISSNGKGGNIHEINRGEKLAPEDIVESIEEGRGSRYNILYEENPHDVEVHAMHVDSEKSINNTQDGLQAAKAHNNVEKIQPIYKKILKQSAEKNPQGIKKPNHGLIGLKPNEKGNKLKAKMLEQSLPKAKEHINEASLVIHNKKNSEMEAMELVMLEHMRCLQDDQREAFEISKWMQSPLEAHEVRNNFLIQNPSSSMRPPDPGSGKLISVLNDPLHVFVMMNIICWNCRGAGGKSFHSLIRDMRKEYDAHFIILLETHVSGMKGKKIRDKMGFDGSFIVEAIGHSGGIWDVVVLDYSHQLVHLQGICKSWPDVKQNHIWRIGDGSVIKFWQHNWVPNLGSLDQHVPQVRTNYVEYSSNWDLNKLNSWLPEDMVKKIAAISPPSPWKMPDHVAWNLDCAFASAVWDNLLPLAWNQSFFSSNLQDWLSSNLSTSRNWQCLFGVVTSSLWFFRNKLIFEGNSTTVASAIAQIRVRFDEFNRSSRSKVHLNAPYANHARLISWKPPSEDAVKLNVDGSYMAITNNAACGGIFRNYLGGFIKGFSCNLGSCSIMHAELWGIVHGLRIATSLNLSCVIVESDSTSALKFITQSCPATHSCSSLIEEIKLQANRIPHVYWNNVPREANSVADQLAKKGQHLPLGLHTFDSAPCEISHILASDIASVPLFRGI
ncbi:hypothetical protein Ahy_B09g100109 [Arachis hypogaea]|uniref:RNase H type-1 domain-containing protein n=1 Tax=Arachis hypogaea TaxID=3818 RepID=A0A444XVW6_ARAHY|nr:hypothetical protein Ahy_B09g100109 [Arachis hypogaea]